MSGDDFLEGSRGLVFGRFKVFLWYLSLICLYVIIIEISWPLDDVINETINYISLAGSSADVKRLLKWLYTLEKEEIVNSNLLSSVEKHIADANKYSVIFLIDCFMLEFHLDLHGYYAFYCFMSVARKPCRQNAGSNYFSLSIKRTLRGCQRVAFRSLMLKTPVLILAIFDFTFFSQRKCLFPFSRRIFHPLKAFPMNCLSSCVF